MSAVSPKPIASAPSHAGVCEAGGRVSSLPSAGEPIGLTKQQEDLLTIVRAYLRAYGRSPSYDELRQSMGLRSKGNLNRLLNALRERGHITWIPNKVRTIALLHDMQCPHCGGAI